MDPLDDEIEGEQGVSARAADHRGVVADPHLVLAWPRRPGAEPLTQTRDGGPFTPACV